MAPNFGILLSCCVSLSTRYVLFTAFTVTTAINEWSSVLYSIVYTAVPTIVVGILDKDLSKRTLLHNPQLYGAGQRQEAYNKKLFWLMIADTLWQSIVVFFAPLFAYWGSTIDISSIGDLWTLSVVILVNLHLAMDVIRWSWIAHASIWGSIIATFICVMIIDAIPSLHGYWYIPILPIFLSFTFLYEWTNTFICTKLCRAIFDVAGTALFWLCLLGIQIAALLPRFVVKFIHQYYCPNDIQISREVEKFANLRINGNAEIEMLHISNPQR